MQHAKVFLNFKAHYARLVAKCENQAILQYECAQKEVGHFIHTSTHTLNNISALINNTMMLLLPVECVHMHE